MRSPVRLLLSASAALALTTALLGGGAADDASIWKPLLSDAEFKGLVEQAAKAIQEELATPAPGTTSANKARALAVLVAASAQSSLTRPGADTGRLAGVRDVAVTVANLIRQQKFPEAAKLAVKLSPPQETGKAGLVALHKLAEREDLTTISMKLFAVRTRGGLGLDSRPAKNLDGIEARLIALGRKPLLPADLAKQADEIVRFACVTAVLGELTHALAPEKDDGKKKRTEWIEWSVQMRDAGRQLADAARSKNPKDVRVAAAKLNSTCTSCHEVFRASE